MRDAVVHVKPRTRPLKVISAKLRDVSGSESVSASESVIVNVIVSVRLRRSVTYRASERAEPREIKSLRGDEREVERCSSRSSERS